MSARRAIFWSLFWIVLSLLLNLAIYFVYGYQKAFEFFTGYLIEKSLSVDNLFVFLLIFTFFDIEPLLQRRVLNYGIIGVIILRGILILLGTALVREFHWIMYLFGAILLYSGYRIAFGEEKKVDPERNFVFRVFRRMVPIDTAYRGRQFFHRKEGRIVATYLFVVLLIIETTDVIFAVDSIPAIFAITTDPFIVFSSNLMAVLGLRSLYFVLESVRRAFVYVKYGVGIVLAFVGLKMLAMDLFPVSTLVSLVVVITILTVSVLFSYVKKPASAGSSS